MGIRLMIPIQHYSILVQSKRFLFAWQSKRFTSYENPSDRSREDLDKRKDKRENKSNVTVDDIKEKSKKKEIEENERNFMNNEMHIDRLNEELKIVEKKIKEDVIAYEEKQVLYNEFKYPGQKYYKATEKEIEILKKSVYEYYLPIECENSTIIRLVDLKNRTKVTSPIFRCVRNSTIGVRKKERRFLFFYSSFICSFCFFMGMWQYKKIEKKKFQINHIINNLNQGYVILEDSFPWIDDYEYLKNKIDYLNEVSKHWMNGKEMRQMNLSNITSPVNTTTYIVNIMDYYNILEWIKKVRNENTFVQMYRKYIHKKITEDDLKKVIIEKYKCRKIQVTGVLDTNNEFYVGPKQLNSSEVNYKIKNENKKYYYVICPFYLKNGKRLLVNRGLIAEDILEEKKKKELPKIVTIRAVLDPGELYESSFKKIKCIKNNKNKYSNYFLFYDPNEISRYANISEEGSFFVASVYDIIFHEDYKNYCTVHSENVLLTKTNETNLHERKDSDSGISIQDLKIDLEKDFDRESQEIIKKLLRNKSSQTSDDSYDQKKEKESIPFRYDKYFIHKKKKEYFKFYADDSTHKSYAYQWFLLCFLFSSISIFKFIQFKRWIY